MTETLRPSLQSPSKPCKGCQAETQGELCEACGAAQTIGGFEVAGVLAQTPHSRLYQVDHPTHGKVVVKELLFTHAPSIEQIDAFDREAKLLEGLEHRSLAPYYGHFQEGRGRSLRLCSLQGFVEGKSLEELVRRGPLPEAQVRDLARQLFEVLSYLHSRFPPVIHRDIKPANLVLKDDGTLVLVDFGVARALTGGTTHGATMVGSLGYAPLEQLGGTASTASDLYGAGATLLHLLDGRPPAAFMGPDLELNLKSARLTSEWRSLLDNLLARKPSDRFRSAADALAALNKPVAAPRRQRRERPRQRSRDRSPRRVILRVLLVVSAIVYFTRDRDTHDRGKPAAPKTTQGFTRLSLGSSAGAQRAALMERRYGLQQDQPLPASEEAALAAAALSTNEGVREEALRLLGERSANGPDTLRALVEGLERGNSKERLLAARAVYKQLPTQGPQGLSPRHWQIIESQILDAPDPAVRLSLANALTNTHPLDEALLARVVQRISVDRSQNSNLLGVAYGHLSTLPVSREQAVRMLGEPATQRRQLAVAVLGKNFPSLQTLEALRAHVRGETDDMVLNDVLLVLRDATGHAEQAASVAVSVLARTTAPSLQKAALETLRLLSQADAAGVSRAVSHARDSSEVPKEIRAQLEAIVSPTPR